ncbi:hypothetical protein ACOMHN_009190 [Nucella lapillus]
MASTEEEEIALPVNHSTPKQQYQKTLGCEIEDCPERKSLQTLQQSALDDTSLVGIGVTHTKHSKSTEKIKFLPSHGHVIPYHDTNDTENGSGRHRAESKATQTDDSLLEDLIQQRLLERGKRDHSLVEEEENEAYNMMVKEPVPESYWQEMAEQRRLALSDTLEENNSLHQSIESLKEENEKLLELASQAEQLSSLLQSVVSEEDDENDEESHSGENEPTAQQTNEGIADAESNLATQAAGSHPIQRDNSAEDIILQTENSGEQGKSKLNADENETVHK